MKYFTDIWNHLPVKENIFFAEYFQKFTSLSSIVGPISAVESLGEDDNEDDCHDDENYDIKIADDKLD